eukprot:345751-Amphidinium_carterae.1
MSYVRSPGQTSDPPPKWSGCDRREAQARQPAHQGQWPQRKRQGKSESSARSPSGPIWGAQSSLGTRERERLCQCAGPALSIKRTLLGAGTGCGGRPRAEAGSSSRPAKSGVFPIILGAPLTSTPEHSSISKSPGGLTCL